MEIKLFQIVSKIVSKLFQIVSIVSNLKTTNFNHSEDTKDIIFILKEVRNFFFKFNIGKCKVFFGQQSTTRKESSIIVRGVNY